MKYTRTVFYLINIAILLSSCTTSSTKNRGSLSGAMDKSRDDYEESRTVPDEDDPSYDSPQNEYPDNPDPGESGESDSPQQSGRDGENSPEEPVSMNVLIRTGRGFIGSPYFDSVFNGELLIGDRLGNWEVYLYGGFSHLITDASHPVSASIKKDAYSLSAGLEGRYYIFPDLKVFSPYVMASIGGLYLFWQFQNPLIAGDDTISSDTLGGLILGTGAGIDLYHGESFKLGISFIPEVYLFGEETSQGFTNDYFNSQGIVRWSLEAGYRF